MSFLFRMMSMGKINLMELPDFKIVFLVFTLGFIVFFLWPRFISPKVELYRQEKISTELQRDYTDVLTGLARIDEGFLGWETLKRGGAASFSAQTRERLDLVEKRINFWQKKGVPDDLKKVTDLNYGELLRAKDLLSYFDGRLVYLEKVELIVGFLKKDLEDLGSKGYSKIVEKPELIKNKRERAEQFFQALATIEIPQGFEEFNGQLKKTVRAQIDFWANNEIAVERRTPTIYSQSFWVLKRDWDVLAEISERDLDIRQDEDFQKMKKEFEEKLNVVM